MRLSIKHSKLIQLAIEEAYAGKSKRYGSFHHGSIIVTNNRVLGRGYNHPRTAYKGPKGYQRSMHAEVCALNRSIIKPRKTVDVYVVRINNVGTLMESRPCPKCILFLKSVGIRKVYYSGADGCIHVEQVKLM